jgi:hypothetical protein
MTSCEELTCPDACSDQLPAVKFSICAPTLKYGQIAKVYIANDGYPLTDENDLAEWQTRANLPDSDPSKIIQLSVIGDYPLPSVNEVSISRGRTATGLADHILNLEVDDNTQENYEFSRTTQCGSFTKRLWFEYYDGDLYGGRLGILGTLRLAEEGPQGSAELRKLKGQFKWKAKFQPCRTTSPMAGIELVEESGS